MADRTSTVRVNVITDASGAGAMLGKFGRVAGVAALGVGALAAGTVVGANKLYEYADASDDANAKIANVVKTMKLFKGETEEVTKRVQDQAKAISLATGVDINSIKATQAKLLTFKELAKSADTVGGAFDRATAAAVDMAALGFGTAETNAVQLGKALNNPLEGMNKLARAGIEFTAAEQQRITTLVETNRLGEAQAFMLKAIETQVGGTAEATAGGFELMKNRLSIFSEELATKALPYLDRFGTFMIETGGPAIVRFGKAVQENVLPALQRFGGFISERVIPVISDLVGWINEHLVPAYRDVLAGALEGAREMFKRVAAAVGDNEPQLKDMGQALKKVGEFLVDKVLPVMGDFYKTYLPALGTQIALAIEVISAMWTHFNNVKTAIDNVISAVKSLIDWLKKIDIPDLGDIPHPKLGRSGNPVGDPYAYPGKGASVTVNVNMPAGTFVGDEAALAREINRITGNDLRRILGPQAA